MGTSYSIPVSEHYQDQASLNISVWIIIKISETQNVVLSKRYNTFHLKRIKRNGGHYFKENMS